jgi:ParB-like chromosome segregation protein Spo0J
VVDLVSLDPAVSMRQSDRPLCPATADARTSFGFGGWAIGPITERAVDSLRPYRPRWLWPPTFVGTSAYEQLRESIRTSGVYRPLIILPDGQVIEGQHRYACSKAEKLVVVPVRELQVPLPLTEAQQLAIEEYAVYDAISRRQLSRAQAMEMLVDLSRGRSAVSGAAARLANLRHVTAPQADPGHVTIARLAQSAGTSPRSAVRVNTVVRHGTPEIVGRLRRSEITPGAAERAVRALRGPAAVSRPTARRPAARTSSTRTGPAAARESVAVSFADVTRQFIARVENVVALGRTWPGEAKTALCQTLARMEHTLREAAGQLRPRTPR